MSRPALVVHGHFYQPPRLDPFTVRMPADPTATPARDWNQRVSADCYRPNALIGNLGSMSWDVERLAGGIDALTERLLRDLPGAPDPWTARDDYVDVVIMCGGGGRGSSGSGARQRRRRRRRPRRAAQ